jgi:hypothetical protein
MTLKTWLATGYCTLFKVWGCWMHEDRLQKGSSVIEVHGSLILPLLHSIVFYTIYHKFIFHLCFLGNIHIENFYSNHLFFSPNIMFNLVIYTSNNNKTRISEHSSGPTFLLYKLILLHMKMMMIIIIYLVFQQSTKVDIELCQ